MAKQDSEPLHMTMLFDFFGDLLTDKQREYFDLRHNEDLSLSEIAESAGISRQGVHDIIARAEKTLAEIEQKTGIVRRWIETREKLDYACAIAQGMLRSPSCNAESSEPARELAAVLDELLER